MKRILSKSEMDLVFRELIFLEENGVINPAQRQAAIGLYAEKEKLNIVKVILTIGAILIGLGIISFIASNWEGMHKLTKLIIIVGFYLCFNILGYVLKIKYPKTSISFIYIGVLIYGAGIFLIGQMFNFGGEFATAFLLWSLGTIPLAFQQKDKYLMLFSNLLFIIYLNGILNIDFPFFAIIQIPIFYFAAFYFDKSKLLLFFANINLLNFILHLTLRFKVNALNTVFLFFVIGLIMYFAKHHYHRNIFRIQGNILFGITGIALTFPNVWSDILKIYQYQLSISISFAVIFTIFLFLLVNKGSLISLIFICALIFRFYTDTFAYLPKALFFIIGGLLLLGFGFYFEKIRIKKKGENVNE